MIKLSNILAIVCLLSAGCFSANVFGDTEFTYQGELKQNGNPANGTFNMNFSLWNAVVGGTQIDSTLVINGVQVVEGKFTVDLDFGAEAFDNSARWLQIAVNGITLSPRNPITRAPYAIQTRGIFVNNDASFAGVGRSNPITGAESFGVHTPVQSGFGGMYMSTDGQNGLPFYGYSAGGDVDAYHYFDGPSESWRLYNGGVRVTVEDNGFVGVGTTNPGTNFDVAGNGNYSGFLGVGSPSFFIGQLTIEDGGNNAITGVFSNWNDNVFPAMFATNSGLGAAIWAQGGTDSEPDGGGIVIVGAESGPNISMDTNEIMARNNGQISSLFLNNDGGNVYVGAGSGGNATLVTPVLQITGGSDFSEMFDVGGDTQPQPGMVVVIDPHNPGRLILSNTEYDRKVAGIISGAGGVATGMTMGHDGTIADGKHPVALTGRVYCLVDATSVAIRPGDMLTTSSTPGHAMRVSDQAAANGAIIGKAMTSLGEGETGLVLVLVNLQ